MTSPRWQNRRPHSGPPTKNSSQLSRNDGEGNGNPLQYSCLEIPWSEEPGRFQSPWSCKESATTEHVSTSMNEDSSFIKRAQGSLLKWGNNTVGQQPGNNYTEWVGRRVSFCLYPSPISPKRELSLKKEKRGQWPASPDYWGTATQRQAY